MLGLDSIIVASEAPRDSASKDSTPVPENRSRQRAPTTFLFIQLNNVSRSLSGVGLKHAAFITFNFLPRHLPPIILIFPKLSKFHLSSLFFSDRAPTFTITSLSGNNLRLKASLMSSIVTSSTLLLNVSK